MKYLLISLSLLMWSCANKENKAFTDVEIIKNSIEAYGGEANLRAIKNRQEQGVTLIFMNDSLYRSNQYKSFTKEGGKHYYQSPAYQKLYGEKLVFASNGEYSWTQNDGALAPYMQPQKEHMGKDGEDYPYLFSLKERGITTKYIAAAEEDGERLHRIDYTDSRQVTEEVYFEEKTWLIRKTRRFIETSQGTAELIRYYQDYRKVAEVMIPFRSESHFPPKEKNVNMVTELALNNKIPDQIFEFPKPKTLSTDEIDRVVGTYRNKGKTLRIEYSNGQLLLKAEQEKELTIVDENLFMYRDGEGEGSRMANLLVQDKQGKVVLAFTLRKETSQWTKD